MRSLPPGEIGSFYTMALGLGLHIIIILLHNMFIIHFYIMFIIIVSHFTTAYTRLIICVLKTLPHTHNIMCELKTLLNILELHRAILSRIIFMNVTATLAFSFLSFGLHPLEWPSACSNRLHECSRGSNRLLGQ